MRMILILLAVLCSTASVAETRLLPSVLTLYNGESRVIDMPGAVRISVGNSDIITSTLLQSGEVVLIAQGEGDTNMQIWFADGRREDMTITIVKSDGWRQVNEIKMILGDIPGISISTVGRRVVIDGNLEARDLARVNTVRERYDDMLIMAREITEYEQKMIYFNVQIAEFDRSRTEELGINWQTTDIAGPSLTYANNWRSAGNLLAGSTGWAQTGTPNPGFGYQTGARGVLFGIASEISSLISLLEQDGSALILSSPRLSARSGGEATLTVGGEVPVITSSLSGTSVDYKEYGVLLAIQPNLDMYDNITARVSVNISQLDLAQSVAGQPAFKKRSTENDVKLSPGETLVLSGLITREEQITYNKVKWLGDIPILGALFRSKSFVTGDTEMVIFITPHVLTDLTTGPNKSMLDRVDNMIKSHNSVINQGLLD